MPTAQEMAMKFRQRDQRLAERERQEQRPKNAGVHADQNKRHRTKANRRAEKQALDYLFGHDYRENLTWNGR